MLAFSPTHAFTLCSGHGTTWQSLLVTALWPSDCEQADLATCVSTL